MDDRLFRFSRATLTERGNIASSVVFDALDRFLAAGGTHQDAPGLLAGFGPGITAEMVLGRWSPAPAIAPQRGARPAATATVPPPPASPAPASGP